jgi:folate-dependent phosphoribosylglycinamide formyltransferase PurN
MIKPLYDPKDGPMRVIGFMSGSGSNIRKLIEHQKVLGDNVYRIVALFSDTPDSNVQKFHQEFHIPVAIHNIARFYEQKGAPRSDLSLRAAFDQEALDMLQGFNAQTAAYGGYMSILSPVLVNAFLGVNVHPADLSIRKPNGKPVYTGGKAVKKAIDAGERALRATTHLMASEVDCGEILMVSPPVDVNPNESYDQNQSRLKEGGDWKIFPKTLEYLAQGRFGRDDEHGRLHFDGKLIPAGIRLEDLT